MEHEHPPSGLPGEPAADEIESLARELTELARREPAALGARVRALTVRQQAELALRLPAAERLELLLHAPKPMQLVRALPDAELYLTAREVGPHDALPLLALASAAQIEHLLDLESWRGDRFDAARSGAWVALLLESGEPTLRRFLRSVDDELLVLLLQRWLAIRQIESEDGPEVHGPGIGASGDERGFVSPDGQHWVAPKIAEHVPAARRLLQMFFVEQPQRYQRLLWSALWELPSDVEEHALHWRNSRLEEHGFPPWDEALSVYAPPSGQRSHPEPAQPERPEGLPAPRSPLRVLSGPGLLVPAMERLSPALRERALHETVVLANRLMVADGADPGDPAAHQRMLEKAAGYVGIALERRGAVDASRAAREIERIPMMELFREGYARAVELQARARRLGAEGWASTEERALELLDTPIRQRVAALLVPRPQYLELARGDGAQVLRDFRDAAEIEETRVALEMAEVVGSVLIERLGLDLPRVLELDAEPPRFSTLLLTVLGWHATRGQLRCEGLPGDVTADFLRTVASRRTAAPDSPERALRALLDELARQGRLDARERAVLGAFGKACLEQLSAECGGLEPGTPVDPRYVRCLMLAR